MSNHLGNVMVTISDKKVGINNNSDDKVDYYTADVISAQDYSCFGATLPAREYNSGNQSNGLNGQSKDKDIQKDHYTALFWEYDSRVGRRWNIDPVPKSMVSPYVVLGDNPISYVDPLGNDWYKDKKGGTFHWEDKTGHGGKLNFWTERDKNNTSTWYGSNKNDIQIDAGNIMSVTVKSSKPGAQRSFLPSSFNHSAPEEAQWKISQINFAKGNYSGISTEQLKMYQRWQQADKEWRQMSYGAVGIMAAPLVVMGAVETGAVSYLWEIKGFNNPLALSGRLGQIAKVKAWMGIGNATADAIYQMIAIGSDPNQSWRDYNPLSTAGNLLFSNPFYSSLPGSIYQNGGNFMGTWGKNILGDTIGNIGMPGGKFGLRLSMEGFVMPLFGNLTADVTTGGLK